MQSADDRSEEQEKKTVREKEEERSVNDVGYDEEGILM